MTKTQIYRLLLALLGTLGVSLQLLKDGWGMLLYYTVLSNILVTSFLFYLVWQEAKSGNINRNQKLLRVKGGVTLSITITFVVYHFLLAPLVKPEDFWNVRNFLVHYIVPVGFILDSLILDKVKTYRITDPLKWTILPLIYSLLALLNGLVTKLPIPGSPDSPYPYFFLNLESQGAIGVLINTVGIALGYILFSYIFLGMKIFIGRKE